jgi:hypothetical protein
MCSHRGLAILGFSDQLRGGTGVGLRIFHASLDDAPGDAALAPMLVCKFAS